MSIKLTNRMKKIVSMCEYCDTIIDVGTDHGKIAIDIANKRLARIVIATDIREEPLLTCKKNAKKYLLPDASIFKTLHSDGLEMIDKKLECGIIIAGMGFDLITKIISDIESYNCKYLILSPHTKPNEFLRFLVKKGINIDKIETVFEDDIAYFIFKCYINRL